jgi:hypothetical protein
MASLRSTARMGLLHRTNPFSRDVVFQRPGLACTPTFRRKRLQHDPCLPDVRMCVTRDRGARSHNRGSNSLLHFFGHALRVLKISVSRVQPWRRPEGGHLNLESVIARHARCVVSNTLILCSDASIENRAACHLVRLIR